MIPLVCKEGFVVLSFQLVFSYRYKRLTINPSFQTRGIAKIFTIDTMRQKLSILLYAMVIAYSGMAQQKSEPMKTALLIVDIQNFYFPGEGPGLVHAEEAGLAAREVLQIFRYQK